MGREYLLNKSRPCAWQPHDEDRVRLRCAGALAFTEEALRKDRFGAQDELAGVFRPVRRSSGLDAIAFRVMVERFLIMAGILERLSESKMQVDPSLALWLDLAQSRFHCFDVFVRES